MQPHTATVYVAGNVHAMSMPFPVERGPGTPCMLDGGGGGSTPALKWDVPADGASLSELLGGADGRAFPGVSVILIQNNGKVIRGQCAGDGANLRRLRIPVTQVGDALDSDTLAGIALSSSPLTQIAALVDLHRQNPERQQHPTRRPSA